MLGSSFAEFASSGLGAASLTLLSSLELGFPLDCVLMILTSVMSTSSAKLLSSSAGPAFPNFFPFLPEVVGRASLVAPFETSNLVNFDSWPAALSPSSMLAIISSTPFR